MISWFQSCDCKVCIHAYAPWCTEVLFAVPQFDWHKQIHQYLHYYSYLIFVYVYYSTIFKMLTTFKNFQWLVRIFFLFYHSITRFSSHFIPFSLLSLHHTILTERNFYLQRSNYKTCSFSSNASVTLYTLKVSNTNTLSW